jgi:hypothetical protein
MCEELSLKVWEDEQVLCCQLSPLPINYNSSLFCWASSGTLCRTSLMR